ncbi:recA bacterial DNA recombination family protein [Mycobacterium xenopi 3993]|nr:recA bacterial DNA recombination family protein [Mycobacterium xenopi 3993]
MPHANHPTHQCVSPWNTADPHRLHLCNEFLARDTSGVLGVFAVCSRDLGAPTCCRTHVRYCGGGSETPTCRWAVLASRPTDQYRSTEHRLQERHHHDASPDREKALELAVAQIEKSYGKGSVMRLGDESRQPISVIPTGSIALDVALGIGGLPRGRIVEIYGRSPRVRPPSHCTRWLTPKLQGHRGVHRRRACAGSGVRQKARGRHRFAAGQSARHR